MVPRPLGKGMTAMGRGACFMVRAQAFRSFSAVGVTQAFIQFGMFGIPAIFSAWFGGTTVDIFTFSMIGVTILGTIAAAILFRIRLRRLQKRIALPFPKTILCFLYSWLLSTAIFFLFIFIFLFLWPYRMAPGQTNLSLLVIRALNSAWQDTVFVGIASLVAVLTACVSSQKT
jgi:hypothetical protein